MPITGRKTQFDWLYSALGTDPIPASLFIWGPHSSGKNYVLNKILDNLKIRYKAQISAEELICGARQFLETILLELGGPEDTKCENGRMFLRNLKSFFSCILGSTEPVVVVVYHSEYLKEHMEILHSFVSAQDYIRQNVCFVLCSTLPWECFDHIFLKWTPVLHFQQYSQDELKQILGANHEKTSMPQDMYQFYVNTIVDYFFMCRDLKQLTRVTVTQFEEFNNCVSKLNERDQSNSHKLFQIIKSKLKQDYKMMNSCMIPMLSCINNNNESSNFIGEDGRISVLNEIPYYSKYILIAAYIASNNPVNSDQKFFVKARGSRKQKNINPINSVSGQTFPIVRLLAILTSLNKDVHIPTDSIIRCQITTLCMIGLLGRVGEDLDDCKYKCLANLDLIKLISGYVYVRIIKYQCCDVLRAFPFN